MRVLILSPYPEHLVQSVAAAGDEPLSTSGVFDHSVLKQAEPDWIVSYGHRHLIRGDVLAERPGRIINLHISYLPYNRGAAPNLWSVIEGTPSGVTIHEIDAGLDTGPIIAQRLVPQQADDTLSTSYWRLRQNVEALFAETWPALRKNQIRPYAQNLVGRVRRACESKSILDRLPLGWDSPVAEVSKLGHRLRTGSPET